MSPAPSASRVCKASLVVLMAVMGCGASIKVTHDYDRDVDFSRYRTFTWLPQDQPGTGDARTAIERNTLLHKRIVRAVARELKEKGLIENATSADLLIVYHTGVESMIDVRDYGYTYDPRGAYWGTAGSRIETYEYQEGTLIVDMIDATTRELVWRGTAQKTLEERTSPERAEQTISEAVHKIFQKYPPPIR